MHHVQRPLCATNWWAELSSLYQLVLVAVAMPLPRRMCNTWDACFMPKCVTMCKCCLASCCYTGAVRSQCSCYHLLHSIP